MKNLPAIKILFTAEEGAEAIKYVNNICNIGGWKLEDCIHYCGNDDEVFNELSLRAFKNGENLV